jgi:hypothetical protein
MPVTGRRLPRTIWLDETSAFTIHYDPPAVIDAAYGKPGKAGYTDMESKTIHIAKNISRSRKWSVLRHELIHALLDLSDELKGGL